MRRLWTLSMSLLLLFAFAVVPAGAAPTLWQTAASSNWNNAANWTAGIPTGTSDVQFDTTDLGFTTTMDLGAAATIASYEILFTTTNGTHTTALGSNQLTMANMTIAESNASGSVARGNLVVTGGVGSALSITSDLNIGSNRGSRATLTLDPDVVMNLGIDANNRASLRMIDNTSVSHALNTVTVTPGTTFNAFVSDFFAGRNPANSGDPQNSRAVLDLSGVTSGFLDISGDMLIGVGFGVAGEVTLSDSVDLKVGVDAGNRGTLQIASGNGKTPTNPASFLNLGAGALEAFLTELNVGYTTNSSIWAMSPPNIDDSSQGTLDGSSITSGFIDVDGPIRIGTVIPGQGFQSPNNPNPNPPPVRAEGTVQLSDINVSATDVEIGHASNDGGFGLLEMDGTLLSISNSLSIDGDSLANQGKIMATINGENSGLSLSGAASITIGEGQIELIFEDPTNVTGSVYWGLRWAGDHVSELEALALADKLIWDDSAIDDPNFGPVGIFLRGGITYVGASHPIPEPGTLGLLGLGCCALARRRRRTGRSSESPNRNHQSGTEMIQSRRTLRPSMRCLVAGLVALVMFASVSTVRAMPTDFYQQSVLADNPFIYWRLGEASTASPAANLGSLGVSGDGVYGPTTALGLAGPIFNSTDTAAGFASGVTTSSVTNSALTFPASSFSSELWVNTSTTGATQGLISYNSPGAENDYLLVFSNANSLNVILSGGTTQITGLNIADGNWHHIVTTWDFGTGNLIVYDNGAVAFSTSGYQTGNGRNALGDLVLGQEQDGTGASGSYTLDANQAFNGTLDEFALYPFVLTPAEVLLHYDVGVGNVLPPPPIPEPSTAALLGLGVMALVRRRKKRSG